MDATQPPTSASDNEVSLRCPFCGSADVEPMSLFGQQLLTVQFYCNNCHTPFEKIKDAQAINAFERP